MKEKANQLRSQILELVAEYSAEAFPPREFIAGETPVPVAGRVFDTADVQSLVDSSDPGKLRLLGKSIGAYLSYIANTGRAPTQSRR